MSRIAQILAALASLVVIVLGLALLATIVPSLFSPDRTESGLVTLGTAEGVDESGAETLSLGASQAVAGTELLRLALISDKDRAGYDSYGKGGQGGYRNLGFIAPDQDLRWMFAPESRQLILDLTLIESPVQNRPDQAMFLSVVERDSNGDGKLNHEDAITLFAARPDGTGLVRLAEGLHEIPRLLRSGGNKIALLSDADARALWIDLDSLAVTSARALTLPGG